LQILKSISHVAYHIVVVVLSAAVALSLPFTVRFVAEKFLDHWALVENEKIFLVSVEIASAVMLILLFNALVRGLKSKKLLKAADEAGLFSMGRAGRRIDRPRMKGLKEKNGFGRNIMLIGSTGYTTFADPSGDLHRVLQKCRGAKIMLLDPSGEGASCRSRSMQTPQINGDIFGQRIMKSIEFLKALKNTQKDIRLKLYRDVPFLKLAILGDYLFLLHYHQGMDMQMMPEYVFRHGRAPGSLYNPFYQYFLDRWHDTEIPEYDLETDELIYRDKSGNEVRREAFGRLERALPA
jgi:hypothetical protein